MNIITITSYPSMPGRFRIKSGGRRGRPLTRDAKCPGEAAAVAMEYAMDAGRPYKIFGPDKVMSLIPDELQSVMR